jgi:diguanylate cyclase (GGDEF)-like protein/PAS domain S-box-containing protein
MQALVEFIERQDLKVLLVDSAGQVLAVGGGLRHALGLRPGSRASVGLSDILSGPQGSGSGDPGLLEMLQAAGRDAPVECRMTDRHGRLLWVAATLSDAADVPMGVFFLELMPIERQKVTIAAARKELEHLSFALDATDQGVWDYNGATGSWYFSPAWKRMRGIPVDEDYQSEGDAWLDNVHPDDREMVRSLTERQYAGELQEVSFEYRERHRAGHWLWIRAQGRRLEGGSDGKPLRIVGTDTDLTALRTSQAALDELERSEMRWKIAVNSAEQGVWDYDLLTEERYYSDTWREMRGLGPHDRLPRNTAEWLERVHPDDRERSARHLAECRSGEVDHLSLEYRERHEAGGWIWILRRGKPVAKDEHGRPTRFVGTDTGVSDIKSRQIEFEALSRRLEMALSTSAVGVWETDMVTREAVWDERTFELFGIEHSDAPVPPGTWEALLHPEDRDTVIEYCTRSLQARGGYACDYRILRPGGQVRHIRCRATIVSAAGLGDKLIGVNWDITPDIERAEALRHSKQLAEAHSRDLEQARRRMEHASLHDSLTNLPNRRYLDRALGELAPGPGGSAALLHIDVDRFKQINDTKGHAAGDALLVHVAGMLRRIVRETDVVARIGGDEFVVLMSPAPPRERIQEIVDNIICAAERPMLWQGQECRTGVSIGIAEWEPSIATPQLLVNADIALYRAKRTGRNCACFFTGSLQEEIVSKKQCADDILKGLERGEFEPWYQLQFSADRLSIVGVEALVRWNHPTRGLLPPGAFLDVANDINAVPAIDRAVLEEATMAIAAWDALGVHVPRVSVNVSARRLGDDALIASLSDLPIDPRRISFELLESIFLDDDNEILRANIDGLKQRGFEIEIDDFGTGHASIASLLRIKPHRLKIDRRLITPIVDNEAQRKLVRSIIKIGRLLDIATCAEGVETALHVDILRDLGAGSLQGFHLAMPMPAHAIPAFVQALSSKSEMAPAAGLDTPDGSKLREFMERKGLIRGRVQPSQSARAVRA